MHRMLLSLAVIVAGCGLVNLPNQSLPPAPGTAVLRLHVVAEPKIGVLAESPDSREYDDVSLTPGMEHLDYADLPDIVVWLEPANGGPDQACQLAPARIDIDSRHVASEMAATVSVGQKIVVHNSSMAADFYSVSDGNDFDLGRIAPDASASYTVKSAGLIEVLTDSARDPVARIYVAPTPWVWLTTAGKTVEFRNLAPGQYKVVTWHPRLPGREITVVLSANQVVTVAAKVGVNDLPKIPSR
jgi:hypothetical protein